MKIRIEDNDGQRTYYVNDVPYNRLEDIPEEHRQYFADSNGNLMPDQFDSLSKIASGKRAGVIDVFRALFSEIKANVQSEELGEAPASQQAPIPDKGRYLRDERTGGSGLPFYVKVLIFSLVGLSAAVFIISRLPKKPEAPASEEVTGELQPVEETVLEVTPAPDAESVTANPDEFRFVIEDPNEPPYRMFTNVFKGNTLLFAFDVPPGKIIETGSERLAIEMETPQGTNLSAAVFDVSILTGQCPPDDVDWTTKLVGATEFKTALVSDSGAGHTYNTHYYIFNGAYCAQFSLTLRSVNAGISDENLKEYSPDNLVGLVEDVLRTMRFE